MARKRRRLSASLKAQVALAAARGDKTTAELASKFAVHASQVTAWKKQLLAGVPELFADGQEAGPERILMPQIPAVSVQGNEDLPLPPDPLGGLHLCRLCRRRGQRRRRPRR